MKRHQKKIAADRAFMAVTAVLLVISLAASGCLRAGLKAGPGSPQTSGVEPVKSLVTADGTVRARQTAELAWQMPGIVGEVQAGVGDTVSAGQELSALDPASLPQVVILAQASRLMARKALDALLNSQQQQALARLSVEKAEQALQDMQHPELARAQAMQAIAAAQDKVDQAELQVYILNTPTSQLAIDQARADLLMSENRLNNSRLQLKKMQNQLKKLAQLPPAFRSYFRGKIQKGIQFQEIQVNRDQMAVDQATEKLNNLLAPADPNDLAVAQANLAAAQAQLDQAKKEYDRLKDGYSQGDIALAEAKLHDAQRQWERVKDGPNPDDLAAAQARVDAAEAALAQTRVTAPFAGVITRVDQQQGDRVKPGDLAFRLDDLSHLLVDVPISEIDINVISTGQPAILTFEGIPRRTYHGTVAEVSLVGTITEGVSTFPVTIEITDADASIRPGMTASVEILPGPIVDAARQVAGQ